MNMAPEEYKGTSFDQIEWIIYLLSGPENCKSIFFFPHELQQTAPVRGYSNH